MLTKTKKKELLNLALMTLELEKLLIVIGNPAMRSTSILNKFLNNVLHLKTLIHQ